MNPRCYIVVMSIVLLGMMLVQADEADPTSKVTSTKREAAIGSCQCGVFKDAQPHTVDCVPAMSKTPNFQVQCNDEGHKNCKDMCTALARGAKDKAPAMLCEAVKDLNEGFKPSVFSRACDVHDWTYTEVTSPDAICCSKGAHIPC